jgi:hypothetical protein
MLLLFMLLFYLFTFSSSSSSNAITVGTASASASAAAAAKFAELGLSLSHEDYLFLTTFYDVDERYPIPVMSFWEVPFDPLLNSPFSLEERHDNRRAAMTRRYTQAMDGFNKIMGLFRFPSHSGSYWTDSWKLFPLWSEVIQTEGRPATLTSIFEKQTASFCFFHAIDCLFNCQLFNIRLADQAIPALLASFTFLPEELQRESPDDSINTASKIGSEMPDYNKLINFSDKSVVAYCFRYYYLCLLFA